MWINSSNREDNTVERKMHSHFSVNFTASCLPGMTLAWNFFSKTGAKSVDICPIALQHAYLRLGDKLLAIAIGEIHPKTEHHP